MGVPNPADPQDHGTYRKQVQVVKVEHFEPFGTPPGWPKGAYAGHEGWHIRREGGRPRGLEPGDYVVTYADGTWAVVPASEWEAAHPPENGG